jgi:phytoene dehydrogenase-like protein
MTDIVLVGAGHNGLVCAGYLAKAGLDVVVVERSHRIGGACITEELVPGFTFSTFAYTAHGPGPKICRDLEIPADAFTIVEYDLALFAPFPDGDHVLLWKDADKTAAGLERFGPREGDGYLAFTDFMNEAVEVMQSVMFSPPPTHQELYKRFGNTRRGNVLEALLTRSFWDVLTDYFQSDKVRSAMCRADDVGSPTTVGSLLAEVTEGASDGAGIENRTGIPRGGMGAITQALADAARGFGAEIRTACAVEGIEVENGAAVGVRLSGGERIRARNVVSNADPKRTFLKLMKRENLNADFIRQVKSIKTRANYMKYHAILSGPPRFTAAPPEFVDDPRLVNGSRIAPSLSYFENAWGDSQSGIPSRDPILSMQLPTAYLPELAPSGKHIFGSWVRYGTANPRERSWEDLREPVMLNIARIVEKYAPGFTDLIEWQKLYSPLDIERETGITDGCIRHVDMTLDQMLDRRPLPQWSAYRTPVERLYLCGSGTHPCGSVTGAPGHNAAQAILADCGLA